MNRIVSALLFVAPLLLSGVTSAGTIIKLGLSTDSLPDIELMDGMLKTVPDAVGATTGDQNTEVTFLGAISSQASIEGDNASFTLSGIQMAANPTIIGTTVLQPTVGGTFELYDPSNVLLLAGTLGNGTLSGPISGTATGGFLTTEFGTLTGGSLLPVLVADDLLNTSFSISLTDVNDGFGMDTQGDGSLADFQADATAIIGAQRTAAPEPGSALLLLIGAIAFAAWTRR